MPKKSKVGKNRKDKFYSIAKEVGYRARSAFKLVQLNRKFQFLQSSRVLIDLCAAPGGWCQVAKQHMPVESKIIGVDLVPIKPISGVITIQEDITTDTCKSKIRQHLRDWKADVVLNDGAPNVGKNWHIDSFSQAELSLWACKLAAFFLRPGGWFITKVFRSNDYNALVWVLKQLFKKVHATKPSASRNESAEIFVVCQGYLAPQKIDPKFFDIKHALTQIESDQKKVAFRDFEKIKKRKAIGYEDNNGLLFKKASSQAFLEADEPLEFLAAINKIELEPAHENNAVIAKDKKVDMTELKINMQDIKVLNVREIKELLKWRTKLRTALGMEDEEMEEGDSEEEELDSEEEEEKKMEEEALEVAKGELKDLRRKKKKKFKGLRRLRDLLSNAVHLDEAEDQEVFKLVTLNKNVIDQDDEEYAQMADKVADADELESGDEDDLPANFNFKKTLVNLDEGADADQEDNELIEHLEDKNVKQKKQSAAWFGQSEWFSGLGDDEDLEKANLKAMMKETDKPEKKAKAKSADAMEVDESTAQSSSLQELSDEDEDDYSSSDDSDDSDVELAKSLELKELEDRIGAFREKRDDKEFKKKQKEENRKREQFPLNPKELALATEMVTSKKRKRDLEEMMYDKFSFNDPEGLPDWFTVDEKRHRKRRLPEVDGKLVSWYEEKQKAANARNIKKVAEAKARKKNRELKRLEKVKRQAEGVLAQEDVSSREKQAQIKRIYGKASRENKKEHITYVPIKTGAGKKVSRPAGVKGKFKVVDSRMKTDMRGQKASERRAGKRPTGGRGLANKKGHRSGRR
ncbi:Oidioi.mRNA.OKI2018_I69.XSR.g16222.t1.cds [Oikopleura dioica]|uniref:Putative rRNA methyltransferase n=1 Tax=Oikopleura dioica TaxID=34765 RepID=A0ABN7SJD0_OIKDI|nr:Oidioi.mRNA.OKI2018_I69.XSR.g16222.t1.cds [Oikopleura dioica]